ncbi:immunity protein Imm33 domain-containing protein [Deinococcus sonorensis]|uniref:immunity protein Imm33 domain-containing protein n=1 Tax=Deinococcus sonorensis TaxID=309891 RepID=UPI003D9AA90F
MACSGTVRRQAQGKHSAWFVWLGEGVSQESDDFRPHHIAHLQALKPDVLPLLGLGGGWRFRLVPGHVDMWYDEALLH